MKTKIASILAAAAFTIGSFTNVYAADALTKTAAYNYAVMSESEKTDFINANLSTRLQHLSRLVSITSNGATGKLEDEIKASLSDGVTSVEIKEAIYHSGAYCGITRAAAALSKADEVLKALGEDTAYKSRITSTEENRYNDGLAVQRSLFGPQIGTITDDMEPSLKLQTLYLSGICFGDFYNRTGLSLYDREFLTLATIAGNGNCRGQLGGHTNGNLNVGHSKDMLRAAMLYNEDINGKEKTELALDVIDTTEAEVNATPADERPQPTNTVETNFESDSEEILSLAEHFKTDDKDNYIGKNIDANTQDILIKATEAVIDNTQIPTSNDKATQILIDLAVIDAQGGRESELADKVKQGYAQGLTNDNMLAVPLLTAAYNGFPRTLNMRGALAAAIADAANTAKTTVTMQIGNPVMTINGTEQNIDENGTVPVVTDDRTLLPVRAFVEGIGGSVDWDENSQTATLKYGENEIKLTIGSKSAYLNGDEKTLDVTPIIINDRTMLPIRFIAESFGFNVEWTEENQTVTIIKSEETTAIHTNKFNFETQTVTLNNGVEMPIFGIGTFALSPEQAENSVYWALKDGYHLIDTANAYNNEEGVAKGIKRAIDEGAVKREDIFITAKIWPSNYSAEGIDANLKRLGVDYVDLMLLHQPFGDIENGYLALEDALKAGKVRAIGLSNFERIPNFEKVMAVASVNPAVLQVETHPYFQQRDTMNYIDKYGTVIEAWYPLGGRGNTQILLNDETIVDIAKAHNKTAAQVILRWHLQAGHIAIPGSSNPDHIKENISIFDFELSDEEMKRINDLDTGNRFFNVPGDDTSDDELENIIKNEESKYTN